jgi:Zn-finger nucleic acid-binding protein
MQTVDRAGVHIDQCQGCRGIFLDRGELEQMIGAEQQYNAAQAPPRYQSDTERYPPQSQPPHHAPQRHYRDSPAPYGHGGHRDSPKPYRGGYSDSPRPYGHGKRKRGSFLEELFD